MLAKKSKETRENSVNVGIKLFYKLSHARIFSVLSCHLKIFSLVSLLFLASIARVIPTHLLKFLIFKCSSNILIPTHTYIIM